MGVAFDLLGNGKTPVKVNLGQYLTALTASNSDLDLNPLNYVANGPWLTPTAIQPARYVRLNAQIDF